MRKIKQTPCLYKLYPVFKLFFVHYHARHVLKHSVYIHMYVGILIPLKLLAFFSFHSVSLKFFIFFFFLTFVKRASYLTPLKAPFLVILSSFFFYHGSSAASSFSNVYDASRVVSVNRRNFSGTTSCSPSFFQVYTPTTRKEFCINRLSMILQDLLFLTLTVMNNILWYLIRKSSSTMLFHACILFSNISQYILVL